MNVYDIDGEVDNPSFTFEDMPEGAHDLRVRAIDEGDYMDQYDYILVNDVLEDCVRDMHELIQSQHQKTDRNQAFIAEMKKGLKQL